MDTKLIENTQNEIRCTEKPGDTKGSRSPIPGSGGRRRIPQSRSGTSSPAALRLANRTTLGPRTADKDSSHPEPAWVDVTSRLPGAEASFPRLHPLPRLCSLPGAPGVPTCTITGPASRADSSHQPAPGLPRQGPTV